MRHKGFTIVELAVVIFIICILVAFFYPSGSPVRGNGRRAACQSNLKQIGLGILQYTQDYDEQLPLLAVHDVSSDNQSFNGPYGWGDAIQPYVKSTQLFQCPSEYSRNVASDATQNNYTDYFMNSNLSGFKVEKLRNTRQVLLAGDGNDGTDATNARYSIGALPNSWRTDNNSPVWRHLDGANYLFADGHVKWLIPSRIQNKANKIGVPTFAIK
jgi:prepilin-type processing-associated H-X9-DG protein/prepilin-type N-terminal cleavage/methylation domain-containing protein